jgi:hypothetical protein
LFRFLPLRALIFFDLGAELEVAATQTLEFADEVFCAAEVPALQRVLSAGSTQFASSALLRRTCLSQTKSAPLGAKTGEPNYHQSRLDSAICVFFTRSWRMMDHVGSVQQMMVRSGF